MAARFSHWFCVLASLWLISFAVRAADAPPWIGADWGADEGAVAAALGERALRLDPPIEYGPLSARLAAKDVAVGGVSMTALYQFGLDGGLKQVLLERRDPGANPKNLAAIEQALSAELGQPAASCERRRGSPKLAERRWRLKGDSVRLVLMDYTGVALRHDGNRDTVNPLIPSYEYTLYSRRSVPKRIVLRVFPASDAALEGPPPCG
jgi:hypothetical protein